MDPRQLRHHGTVSKERTISTKWCWSTNLQSAVLPVRIPVTYIKAFDGIRDLFASIPESQKRGFTAGHFSFNIPGGRCENCQGDGTVTVEMQFLADVELICEECKGTRYKPQVLEVRYKGKNIHEVLNLTVKEALQFFSGAPKIVEKMRVLEEVGLGYLATWPVGHDAVGRRGPAHETGCPPATRQRASSAGLQANAAPVGKFARFTFSTNPRPGCILTM